MNKAVIAASFSSIVLVGCGGGSGDTGNVTSPTTKSNCGEIHLNRGYSNTELVSSYWGTQDQQSRILSRVHPSIFSGSVETTLTSSSAQCQQSLNALSGYTYHTWEGESQGNLATGEQFYFKPTLRVQYDLPPVESYQKWVEDSKPEFVNTTINKVELYSVVAIGFGSNAQEFKPSSSDAMHLTELPLQCTVALPTSVKITESSPKSIADIQVANIDTRYCGEPYNDAKRELVRNCISASPSTEKTPVNCTFNNAKVGVPDNKGNYFPAYVSGSVTREQGQDFVLQVNKVEY
ncbi:hypothetical protein Q8W40_11935 [Vibrio penaeicida]|uniref:hypothetical protein n=1 Tax=Vibrio penaeicida TaxID=104609 RepID=UPI002736515D|nr:hypothetical protein [Vibrio penaeicida]MDP2572895.1 hypothetical protein [Vibrio penaeicida]